MLSFYSTIVLPIFSVFFYFDEVLVFLYESFLQYNIHRELDRKNKAIDEIHDSTDALSIWYWDTLTHVLWFTCTHDMRFRIHIEH